MRARVYGPAGGEHVALIGVWDPIGFRHEELFRDTVVRASLGEQKALVVTLDPAPAAQMWGRFHHPAFNDIPTRLHVQRQCGVQTQVVVRLRRQEIYECGAEYFLSRLRGMVSISTIRLGVGQSLGRGPHGSVRAIVDYCNEYGINVERLPPVVGRSDVPAARDALRRGCLRTCLDLLDRPLFWSRPRSEHAVLSWPPGRYRALPMTAPAPLPAILPPAIDVELESHKDMSRFRWPDRAVRWLAFIAGPGDPTTTDP